MNWPPYIAVEDGLAALAFLERAAAEPSLQWVDPKTDDLGCDKCLSLGYGGSAFDGDGLYVAFCLFGDDPHSLQVTMHAARWGVNRDHPSEEEYLRAEELVLPLLRAASTIAQRRLALKRPRRKPPLRGKLKERFEAFCHLANDSWSGSKLTVFHPYDYERFYRLIVVAHRYRSALTPEQLRAALLEAGFSDVLSHELAIAYETGRRVLMTASPLAHRHDIWHPWARVRRKLRNEK